MELQMSRCQPRSWSPSSSSPIPASSPYTTTAHSLHLVGLHLGAIDYAWWTDCHGEQNIYFTGENKGYHVCDCHYEDKGCF